MYKVKEEVDLEEDNVGEDMQRQILEEATAIHMGTVRMLEVNVVHPGSTHNNGETFANMMGGRTLHCYWVNP